MKGSQGISNSRGAKVREGISSEGGQRAAVMCIGSEAPDASDAVAGKCRRFSSASVVGVPVEVSFMNS